MRKNINIINSEVVHFKDANGGKDRQGNIQTHHIETKYINDYEYRINELLQQKVTANATTEKDSDFVGMDKRTMSKAVFDYHYNNGYGNIKKLNKKEIFREVIFKHTKIDKISNSKKNIENSIQHCDIYRKNGKVFLKDNNQAIAFKFLDKIIENGIIISKELNWKDDQNQYNTYLMGTCIKIDDSEFIVESIVKDLQNGEKQFYLHNVIKKEKFQEMLNNHFANNQATNNILGDIKSNIADFVSNVKYFLHDQQK
ncbi:MAG: hypothetical protein Ta2D_00180 [Rickettsiales bacterium]|nr:MAG: hypothetical protein Ta2D_00180 [Rickettsiales bacterium]